MVNTHKSDYHKDNEREAEIRSNNRTVTSRILFAAVYCVSHDKASVIAVNRTNHVSGPQELWNTVQATTGSDFDLSFLPTLKLNTLRSPPGSFFLPENPLRVVVADGYQKGMPVPQTSPVPSLLAGRRLAELYQGFPLTYG